MRRPAVGPLLVLCGCNGNKERATVKGTITLGGQPLKMGTVVFTPADKQGSPGSGLIDSTGNYTVNDAPVGEVTVCISLPPRPMGRRPVSDWDIPLAEGE